MELEKLTKKLTITKNVIVGLLIKCEAKELIEKKLGQLEELIAEIPSSLDGLTKEWNDTVVQLWTRFGEGASLSGENQGLVLVPSLTEPSFRDKFSSPSRTVCSNVVSRCNSPASKDNRQNTTGEQFQSPQRLSNHLLEVCLFFI